MNRTRCWSQSEDALLLQAVDRGGTAAAVPALPNRSVHAIQRRLRQLSGGPRRPRWTGDEVERLRVLCTAPATIGSIAAALGRTESAVREKTQAIGISLACPQGYEYVSAAACRTGYTPRQLRKILRWAGVAMLHPLSLNPHTRERIVEIGDVDDAVDRYLEAEPCWVAARRAGIHGRTLARRLARLGLKRPRGRRTYRVTPEQVAQALTLRTPRDQLHRSGATP